MRWTFSALLRWLVLARTRTGGVVDCPACRRRPTKGSLGSRHRGLAQGELLGIPNSWDAYIPLIGESRLGFPPFAPGKNESGEPLRQAGHKISGARQKNLPYFISGFPALKSEGCHKVCWRTFIDAGAVLPCLFSPALISGKRMSRSLRQCTIFVVDDEPVVAAFTLSAILKRAGFAVQSFTNPLEALRAVTEQWPDLLLTDVAMPGISGVELAIRTRALSPQSKVLLFSGQTRDLDLSQAREQGHHFQLLAKPMHPGALLDIIDERLGAERCQKQAVGM
jgi:CheY-like chemotaxis protein